METKRVLRKIVPMKREPIVVSEPVEIETSGVDYSAVIKRYENKVGNSRKAAIRARCIQCCAGQLAEVRYCTAVTCALHGFRMGNTPEKQAQIDSGETVETSEGDDDENGQVE